jgi:pseudouridine-5'-phosphate glycosidase
LLKRLAEVTEGRTLHANQALVVANARLAAQVAGKLAEDPRPSRATLRVPGAAE